MKNTIDPDDTDRMPSLEDVDDIDSPQKASNKDPNQNIAQQRNGNLNGSDSKLKQNDQEINGNNNNSENLANGENMNRNPNDKRDESESEQEESDKHRKFYPKIIDYFPGGMYNNDSKEVKLGDKNDLQYQAKMNEELKRLEKYLNTLFPENIQTKKELYDSEFINQHKDPQIGKRLIQSKLDDLQDRNWTIQQLKEKIIQSYKDQADQLSKISMLYTDHIIQQNNLNEKQKKIEEIQKILRDLNEYKIAYLDLHNIDKLDQLQLQYKLHYSKEANDLAAKLDEVIKERDSYKHQYTIFKEKYEIIYLEAKEAKNVIQDQIKELLAYKKKLIAESAKLQEQDKSKTQEEAKRTITSEAFQNRANRGKSHQRRASLNNTLKQKGHQNNEENINNNNPHNDNPINPNSFLGQFTQQYTRPLPQGNSLANGFQVQSTQPTFSQSQQTVNPFIASQLNPNSQIPNNNNNNPNNNNNNHNNNSNNNNNYNYNNNNNHNNPHQQPNRDQPNQQSQSQYQYPHPQQQQGQQMNGMNNAGTGGGNGMSAFNSPDLSTNPVVEPFNSQPNYNASNYFNQQNPGNNTMNGNNYNNNFNKPNAFSNGQPQGQQPQNVRKNWDWPDVEGDKFYGESTMLMGAQQGQMQQLPQLQKGNSSVPPQGGVPLRPQPTAMFGNPEVPPQLQTQQSILFGLTGDPNALMNSAGANGAGMSESKRSKKGQVQFQDMSPHPGVTGANQQTAQKTKEQEESDYYNQLCAKKIKGMVKAISSSHSLLIEESSMQNNRKSNYNRF